MFDGVVKVEKKGRENEEERAPKNRVTPSLFIGLGCRCGCMGWVIIPSPFFLSFRFSVLCFVCCRHRCLIGLLCSFLRRQYPLLCPSTSQQHRYIDTHKHKHAYIHKCTSSIAILISPAHCSLFTLTPFRALCSPHTHTHTHTRCVYIAGHGVSSVL